MLTIFFRVLVIILFLPILACSTPPANAAFQAGKDYQVIPSSLNNSASSTSGNKKIIVMEFFSYGCPWCYRVEPSLETWLAHKSQGVEFDRVPVVFEQGWDTLAKIYYTSKTLGVSEKLILPLFKAIQDDGQNLTEINLLKQFFAEHGVSQQDFDSAYNFSPGIEAQMMRGDKLMRDYAVYAIPAFVIDGKYMTNMGMANGDTKRLLKIVDFLIAKEKAGANFVAR